MATTPRSPKKRKPVELRRDFDPADHMRLLQQRENRLREWQEFVSQEIQVLFRVFYRVNGVVIGFVSVAWIVQTVFAFLYPTVSAFPVLITERVVLALIAASAAQLGALAFGVGRVLFKPPPTD